MVEMLTLISVWFIGLWMASVFAVILFSMIGGRIALTGLLLEPLTNSQAPLSRPQLLVSSVSAAAAYLGISIANLGSTRDLPDAPLWVISGFAASHSLYLGGRGVSAVLTKMLGEIS
jgi:hypothetical protein